MDIIMHPVADFIFYGLCVVAVVLGLLAARRA